MSEQNRRYAKTLTLLEEDKVCFKCVLPDCKFKSKKCKRNQYRKQLSLAKKTIK